MSPMLQNSLLCNCIQSIALLAASIQPFKYASLRIGSITPSGWLQTQLEIQAEGLTGHLSEFWHGVNQSSWIVPGGTGDNALEEYTPYWLNGMVPLHFLLPKNKELASQTLHYISYILSHQASDGWLGEDNIEGGNMYWGRWNLLNAFRMYAEGNTTMSNTLQQSMLRYILQQEYRMMNNATFGKTYTGARWMDFVLSAMWLLENGDPFVDEYAANLMNVIQLSIEQGFNWESWFEYELPTSSVPGGKGTLYTHGVNNAQAFKSAAVLYRYFPTNETLRSLSLSRLYHMDEYHGQATGMFGADEHLAGRFPSRGTELCAVVEYMWSFQIMFRVFGDIRYLDRLERVSMNALAATFGSPKGGDMWAHQYLQQNNEINAMNTDPHVWVYDGPQATVYGLEPNYACCTANFNQGWPKFASAIYFSTNDGVVIGIYAPSKTNGVINNMASFNITTNYPFEDDIFIYIDAVKRFDLYLRIPHWTKVGDVVMQLSDDSHIDPSTIKNGTLYKLSIPSAGAHKLHLNFNPKVRMYRGANGSVALLRGSVLFSLPIDAKWETKATYAFDSKDYWCLPQTKWNYALNITDLNNMQESVKVVKAQWIYGHAPFNRTDVAMSLIVEANEVYTWKEEEGAAGAVPQSPACANADNCDSKSQSIVLVPHGTTDLRIAEFPLANTHY